MFGDVSLNYPESMTSEDWKHFEEDYDEEEDEEEDEDVEAD